MHIGICIGKACLINGATVCGIAKIIQPVSVCVCVCAQFWASAPAKCEWNDQFVRFHHWMGNWMNRNKSTILLNWHPDQSLSLSLIFVELFVWMLVLYRHFIYLFIYLLIFIFSHAILVSMSINYDIFRLCILFVHALYSYVDRIVCTHTPLCQMVNVRMMMKKKRRSTHTHMLYDEHEKRYALVRKFNSRIIILLVMSAHSMRKNAIAGNRF